MKSIQVRLGKRSYPVFVGNGVLPRLGSILRKLDLGSRAAVVTTGPIYRLYGRRTARAFAAAGIKTVFRQVPDTEKSKSLRCAGRLLTWLAEIRPKDRLFLVAFGGGVVGDLTGFAAAIYRRGIPYVQLPTTLLSQVDSSIGGKTAVDLPHGKNLAGAFYQPRLVFIDTDFLQTLPPREVRCGLAEVVKYGVIKDPGLFAFLEKNLEAILNRDPAALAEIIYRCARIKARVVETDEYDRTEKRMILNFGHTLGHAIEAAAGYGRYRHGEAVSIGMAGAAEIGVRLGMFPPGDAGRLERLLVRIGLPVRARNCSPARIMNAQALDKKFIGRENRFVLPVEIGRVEIRRGVARKTIASALKKRLDR